jgi:hypothetical protein
MACLWIVQRENRIRGRRIGDIRIDGRLSHGCPGLDWRDGPLPGHFDRLMLWRNEPSTHHVMHGAHRSDRVATPRQG